MASLVDDGINGLKFKYNSSQDLTDNIQKFETSDKEIMGENAYKKFKSEYFLEQNYKCLNEIYCS